MTPPTYNCNHLPGAILGQLRMPDIRVKKVEKARTYLMQRVAGMR